MKILILENDTDYTQRFKYYLEKKHSEIQISICDNEESAKKVLSEEKFDVVLFGASFDKVELDQTKNSAFAYISSVNEIINDKDTIYKYRSVSELYSKICEVYEKKKNRIIVQNDSEGGTKKKCEVITFIPVNGGAGSSTMAAACAISLAKEAPVLYINMEQCSSDSVFFKSDCKLGLTDILATLKTKYTETGIYQLLKDVISADTQQTYASVSYIKGYKNILDCCSMTEQSIEAMLSTLRSKFDFRYIVIDTDCIVGNILQKLITQSDKLVFVSSGSDISLDKFNRIKRYLNIIERKTDLEMPKNYILFNQYYGSEDVEAFTRDMTVVARLARYRTDDNSHITSQKIIDVVLGKGDVFANLK